MVAGPIPATEASATRHAFSWKAIARRFAATNGAMPRWLNALRYSTLFEDEPTPTARLKATHGKNGTPELQAVL